MSDIKIVSNDDGKFRQFLAAIIVNLIAVSYGTLCGWPSPVLPQLQNVTNPAVDSPMSEEACSWVGGLLCLGGLVASLFSGNLVDAIGRKRFAYAASLPILVSLLLSAMATSHFCVYASRFIGGMGGAMGMFLVPTYVSEIASEEIRGALGSLLVFAINIGILLVFVAGTFMSYVALNVFLMAFPLIFLLAFFFLPETPVHLVKQNRLLEANKSLMYFKGNNKALAGQELSRLQAQIHRPGGNPERRVKFRDLLYDRAARKGLIISLGLLAGQQLCGIFAMISYAKTIFDLSGSSLSSDAAAITIGVIQVLGSYLSTVLMERAGRRPLVLVSCAGMSLCHLMVGLFCYAQSARYDVSSVSWLPVAALSAYMIVYCLGMGPVPFVVASEVFRVDLASLANTVCFVFLWSMAFMVMKLFGLMIRLIGIGCCFFLLSTFCASAFVFAFYMLPETKGRTRADIVDELAGVAKSSPYSDVKAHYKDANAKDLAVAGHV